jgi:hypothetical protein
MSLVINFWDICVWLAANSIILLVTSEILFSITSEKIQIEKRKFRIIAWALVIAFIMIVPLMAYNIWIGNKP